MSTPAERNRALNGLTARMLSEFSAIWKRLNLNDPNVLRDPLAAVLAEIADKYGTAAAALAADFYDDMRESVVKTSSRFTPKIAELPGPERFKSLAGWGIGPLFGADPDATQSFSNLGGGLKLIVGDAYRETIMESSIADPAAQGWQRVADGNACAFCVMLESRGFTYTEAGSDFAAHSNCGCTAEPQFLGEPKTVQPYEVSDRRVFDAETGELQPIPAAERARIRAWMEANL